MVYPESAGPIWFGQGRADDGRYLDRWRNAPLTYSADQELDHHWNVDHYEIVLGKDQTGDLFQRAARLTMTNQFYPTEVMLTTSDYSRMNRAVQAGDRVLQRIRLFEIAGRSILEMLTMNEITDVVYEERRAGFTYTTTAAHSEIGEWTPMVEWRENGEVVLVISVVSRAQPGASALSRRFARRMQLRAHRLSITHFLTLLNGGPRSLRRPHFSAELLPAGLLATAFLLVVAAALGFNRRSH
jgi:uncharacterized protein (UPF0548 family)